MLTLCIAFSKLFIYRYLFQVNNPHQLFIHISGGCQKHYGFTFCTKNTKLLTHVKSSSKTFSISQTITQKEEVESRYDNQSIEEGNGVTFNQPFETKFIQMTLDDCNRRITQRNIYKYKQLFIETESYGVQEPSNEETVGPSSIIDQSKEVIIRAGSMKFDEDLPRESSVRKSMGSKYRTNSSKKIEFNKKTEKRLSNINGRTLPITPQTQTK